MIMERSVHPLAVKSQKWLVEALLDLIRQKPYEEITISELCKNAKLDRRTFYRNFKDKNDVLRFYFSTLQVEYVTILKETRERTFFTLTKILFEFWVNHLEFLKTAHHCQTLSVMLFQMFNDFIPSIYSQATDDLPQNLRYNLAFVIGGFHNVLIHWVSSGLQETPEEIAATVSEMIKDTRACWPDI